MSELVGALSAIATGGVHRIRHHRDWDPIQRVHIPRPPVVEHHPGLWEELETTLTRQGRVGGSSPPVRGKGESPLMFHDAASEVKSQVLRTVRHWKAVFLAANPHLLPPRTSVPEVCTWLAGFPALLASLQDAPAMHGDFWALAGRDGAIQRVINRAPDRIYLGICSAMVPGADFPCDADVYALAGRNWAVCPTCKTEHEVAFRRERLLESVGRQVMNSVAASRLLASFGIDVPSSTIRSWTQRRVVRGKVIEPKLHPHCHDTAGSPLYLVQSVLDLYNASLEKKRKAA